MKGQIWGSSTKLFVFHLLAVKFAVSQLTDVLEIIDLDNVFLLSQKPADKERRFEWHSNKLFLFFYFVLEVSESLWETKGGD